MPELEPGEHEQDYYRVLGLKARASDEEIRHHYYVLAKKWHPDRFTHANEGQRALAERRMKQINRAYHILGDEVLRHEYDELRHALLAQDEDGHLWRPIPGMDSFSSVPPGYAAPRPSPLDKSNPNGTGFLAALLCFLLALGCLWALITHQTSFVGGSVLIVCLALLTILGILFLQQDSILSRGVNTWMNAEPKDFRQMREQASRARVRAEPAPGVVEERPLDAFEMLVDEALASLPAEFQDKMEHLIVLVEEEPEPELLERLDVPEGGTLLGLYQGVPLTKQGAAGGGPLPERITIYQKPIEAYCHGDPDLIREQVASTVLHEVAHHFGIEHEEMPIWVK
ncbi:MAG TPA: metallopeptidase family protein [Ktedonobacterales bacterium]|jgi:predicted Zn-dependent protease with MMP-like domain/curved DNA-binding protein CbpA